MNLTSRVRASRLIRVIPTKTQRPQRFYYGQRFVTPYASVHFTRFGFTGQYGLFSQYRPVSTFAFTAGLVVNRPSSPNTPVKRREKLPVLHTQEYYLRKSKRQNTTAWVLLGSGVTLLTTGIIVAARQEDGVEAAISLVFIGGPGIVSSLVSIPFFVSSAHNKKRATTLSSSVGWQQGPHNGYRGSAYKSFPAMGVKLDF